MLNLEWNVNRTFFFTRRHRLPHEYITCVGCTIRQLYTVHLRRTLSCVSARPYAPETFMTLHHFVHNPCICAPCKDFNTWHLIQYIVIEIVFMVGPLTNGWNKPQSRTSCLLGSELSRFQVLMSNDQLRNNDLWPWSREPPTCLLEYVKRGVCDCDLWTFRILRKLYCS